MRIRILTVGSRGDVQPYVALGLGLKSAGHDVRIVTHSIFESFIRHHALDFFPLQEDPRAVTEKAGPLRPNNQFSLLMRARPLLKRHFEESLAGCQDAQVVVASLSGALASYHVAEKLGIPFYPAFCVPVTPTRAFPSYMIPLTISLGGAYNRFTYWATDLIFWLFFGRGVNEGRQAVLHLPPTGYTKPRLGRKLSQCYPVVYGFSPAILPKPMDWGEWIHVTGYWFLDRSPTWQPPANLLDFLRSGTPPIYIGFGSMTNNMMNRTPDGMIKLVSDALARAKRRGVVESGWVGLADKELPDYMFKADGSIPHDWLFPQMAAAVHHAGAGTTFASLRAGIPTVTVPVLQEAFLWGRRVFELGVGPRPIAYKRLSADRLAAAIHRAVSDKEMQARAIALGQRIREEDGVARAVEVFHRLLAIG